MSLTEADVEDVAIGWLQELGYEYLHGSVIAPDGEAPERKRYSDCILEERFRFAVQRINTHLPTEAVDGVVRSVLHLNSPSLEENNHTFHRWLTRGMDVEVKGADGVRGDHASLVDFENPNNNDWLVVNQFTVMEGKHHRRPDLVVFLNGLPVAVIELKNPSDDKATVKAAWRQLQTYKDELPSLFVTNEILVVSDGTEARVGSLTAGYERFGPWRTVDGEELASRAIPQLQVLLYGLFEKQRLLSYLQHFIFYEAEDTYTKKIAGYHQYHAVLKAVDATVRASEPEGDRRIGVVWHTQGSGKSVSMVFFAAKLMVEPAMQNPTLLVLTDRNDLDDQLFNQFCAAKVLLPEKPKQAENREDIRAFLQVASGGILFSTMQKFGLNEKERKEGADFPMLSERQNIVVIADEAHRSQYGFATRINPETGENSAGFAKNLRLALPNASFIGFTGTPIALSDKSTLGVFGDYIDTYPIGQAVEDKATVPIFYEARLARIDLPEEEKPRVDDDFEDVTEGEEETAKRKLKSKWARLEAMVGTEKRLGQVAQDIVEHWERRLAVIVGKGMIVAMSRRVCVDLYDQLVALRPDWHSDEDAEGAIKVVMTGSASDPASFQSHIRKKSEQKKIEKRFKDPKDPLQLVIVRDMWLTGFDVPSAHTLYLDKPMKGHTLMQAIARVNRVFKDKPSGLVVDYLGLAENLRQAVGEYGGGAANRPSIPIEEALQMLREKFSVVKAMFHGFDYDDFFSVQPASRLHVLTGGVDHILGLTDGKKRYLDVMAQLNKAAGIALHLEGARELQDEVGYFQAVQKNIRKYTVGEGEELDPDDLDTAIRQIVSGAILSEGVVDIFDEAGLKKPDISILSDQFLETIQTGEHPNLQMELLRRLISDEIRAQSRRNVIQARKFSEMLERTILAYQNRTLESAEVILELIELAKEMRDAPKRGDALGLSEDELAFYDALVAHGNVRELMGDEILAVIAQDLVLAIRGSVAIDWTQKEAVRAKMRSRVKRLLRKHGYPPDKRKEAVLSVIEQAEVVCKDWAEDEEFLAVID